MARSQRKNNDRIDKIGRNRFQDFSASERRVRERLDDAFGPAPEAIPLRTSWRRTFLGFAAALVLVLITWFSFREAPTVDPNELYARAEHLRMPCSVAPISPHRGAEVRPEQQLEDALAHYALGNYAGAAEDFVALAARTSGREHDLYSYYAGVTLHLSYQSEPAVRQLTGLLNSLEPTNALHGTTALYLGLALIDLHRLPEARAALERIHPRNRHAREDAAPLLELL